MSNEYNERILELLFEEGLEDEALKYFKIAKKFKFKNVTILNNIALI